MAAVSRSSSAVKAAKARPGELPERRTPAVVVPPAAAALTTAAAPADPVVVIPAAQPAAVRATPPAANESTMALAVTTPVFDPDKVTAAAVGYGHFLAGNKPVAGTHPAWADTRIAMRHLNNVTPLLLAVAAQGLDARDTVPLLMGTTSALADIIGAEVCKGAGRKSLGKTERLELESLLHQSVGLIAERHPSDVAGSLKRFVEGFRALYTDPAFAAAQAGAAAALMEIGGYQAVDRPETMESRLAQSRHTAHLRLHDAVMDDRLLSSAGTLFSYAHDPLEVASRLLTRFDEMIAAVSAPLMANDELTNDQRTAVLQGWMKHGSALMAGKYLSYALRANAWLADGKALGEADHKARWKTVERSFDEMIAKCGQAAHDGLALLIAQFLPSYSAPTESVDEDDTAAPAP